MNSNPRVPVALLLALPTVLLGQTIAYYQFNGPLGGAVVGVPDSGPNHLDGAGVGAAAYSAGPSGTCFDGTGDLDYVRIPHAPALVLSGDFTVELFFRPNQPYVTYGSDASTLITKHQTAAVGIFLSSFSLEFSAAGHVSGLVSYPGTSSGLAVGPSPKSYALDQWHHAALVYRHGVPVNMNSLLLYVDYELAATASGPAAPVAWGNFAIAIGAGNFPGGQDSGTFRRNFDGKIDEVRITGAALTPQDFLIIQAPQDHPLAATRVPSGVELSWASKAGAYYQLVSANSLTSPVWTPFGGIRAGNGLVLTEVDGVVSGQAERYFRLLETP